MAHTEFGPSTGSLTLATGVAGKAARAGHRLTIEFEDWTAEITGGRTPTAVRLAVQVGSLQVRSGEGGLTPMTPPERLVARANALKSLKADKHPEIVFAADEVTADDDGFRLSGTLTINGQTRPRTVRVAPSGAGAERVVVGESTIRQSDFGVKPYSLMMGTLKVADEVAVRVELAYPE